MLYLYVLAASAVDIAEVSFGDIPDAVIDGLLREGATMNR
jgi:hypothetical protein